MNHASNSSSTSSSTGVGVGVGVGGAGGSASAIGSINYPSQPQHYVSQGEHIVAGNVGGQAFFVVVPKIVTFAPGVVSIDGHLRVDGLDTNCDNQQRAGLPRCFPEWGK